MPNPKGTAQVVDTSTGEVFDFVWETPHQLRESFERAKKLEEAAKRAREKIQAAVQDFLGDEDTFDFGDGSKFMWVRSTTKKYSRFVVAKYLGEDDMELVSDINSKKLKDLLAQMVKDGSSLPPGAWDDIETNAEVTYRKPYVKLERSKW